MEANRCAISGRDCEAARQYLEAYVELKQKESRSGTNKFSFHQEGLLIAAIISYSRAFTDSRGAQFAAMRVKVNLDKVFKSDPSKIKLHKLVLEKRHNAVAHAAWAYHKTELLGLSTGGGVVRKYAVIDYSKGIDIDAFHRMAETMRNHFQHEAYDRDVRTNAGPKKEG